MRGALSTAAERRLPIIAAVAGMAVPALVYLAVTGGDPALVSGWAIPAATDIAFAIGVLAILGRHAPPALKLLLVTHRDHRRHRRGDRSSPSPTPPTSTAWRSPARWRWRAAMAAMGQFGVRRLWPFIAGFVLLWLLRCASGVHATIAGVRRRADHSARHAAKPSRRCRRLEHAIHPWVMFGVVPLFGLASAGVALDGGIAALAEPLPLGILLGLFVGKQLGVFARDLCGRALGLRADAARDQLARNCGAPRCLCGIGFTMSLFIGALAFPADPALVEAAKIGTLAGSLLSALAGYLILRSAPAGPPNAEDEDECEELFAADEPDDGGRTAREA